MPGEGAPRCALPLPPRPPLVYPILIMRTLPLLLAFFAVSTAFAQPQACIYRSDFAKDLSGFSVQWTGSGHLDLALDPVRRGPSGAPALHTTVAQLSTGTVGVNLKVGAERRSEDRWQFEVWGAATLQEGGVPVALQCWDDNGKQVDWIGLGSLAPGDTLKPLRVVVEIPPACTNLNLLFLHEKMRGESWIADVSVKPFVLSPAMQRLMSPPGPTRWGTTSFLRGGDPTLRDTAAKLFVAAGVTHTRAGIDWRNMEPERGKYDWSSLDTQLANLERYGAKADVVFVHGTPEWASGKTWEKDLPADKVAQPWLAKRCFFPPRDWGDWQRFVTALVTHAKGRVRAWEIMNEPDLWSEGFCGTYDDYRQYLRIAHDVVKRADPKAQVLCAAFVFSEWLSRLLADGSASLFDGVCVHPYHPEPAGTFTRVRQLQIQLALADAPKPVFVTEMGYQSGGWKEGPAVKTSEEDKAQCGAEALRGLAKATDFVCWYTGTEAGNMYGLLRDDGDRLVPMPIYYEYAKITGRLGANECPVRVEVTVPPGGLRRGEPTEIRLRLTNPSAQRQQVRFGPVGFVTNLGFSAEDVRKLDWDGVVEPGETRTITLTARPTKDAKGSYLLGAAILTDAGNALALESVSVAE